MRNIVTTQYELAKTILEENLDLLKLIAESLLEYEVINGNDIDLLMREGVLRNHIHLGSVNAAPRDFRDALTHLEQLGGTHADQVRQLLTDRVVPTESLWHYQHRRPQGIKTVVAYE